MGRGNWQSVAAYIIRTERSVRRNGNFNFWKKNSHVDRKAECPSSGRPDRKFWWRRRRKSWIPHCIDDVRRCWNWCCSTLGRGTNRFARWPEGPASGSRRPRRWSCPPSCRRRSATLSVRAKRIPFGRSIRKCWSRPAAAAFRWRQWRKPACRALRSSAARLDGEEIVGNKKTIGSSLLALPRKIPSLICLTFFLSYEEEEEEPIWYTYPNVQTNQRVFVYKKGRAQTFHW